MKRIAILGATGYIGKSLMFEFTKHGASYELFLFSRSQENLSRIAREVIGGYAVQYHVGALTEFDAHTYDVIINCTGIGDQAFLKKDPKSIFTVTETIDAMIINHCEKTISTLYINLSSGAVYGASFMKEVSSETKTFIPVNNLDASVFYSIAKINAEAKHRALRHLNIVDLRIFSFFSQFVDSKASFLMSDIVNCLEQQKVLITKSNDIVRDYSSPQDLFSLLVCIMQKDTINDFFDVYSSSPISKFELLAFLSKNYGLQYSILESGSENLSQEKSFYYSSDKKAETIGYIPKHTSISGIVHELDLRRHNSGK